MEHKKLTWFEKYQAIIKKHKQSRKQHTMIGIVLTLGLLLLVPVMMGEAEPMTGTDAEEPLFTAHMVGDIMLGRHVEEVIDHHGYDYLFRYVQPLFEESDYVTGNFEHPILIREEEEYPLADKYIHVHAQPESVPALQRANFSNVTLANNHTMDYGFPGLEDTLDTFEEAGMAYVGAGRNEAEAREILYEDINGLTVATLGFTDSYVAGFEASGLGGGVMTIPQDFGSNPDDVLQILSDIREASQNADLVFVHVHWGMEYDNSPHERQEAIGRAFANAGADIVIGHHPHVLMRTEVYDPADVEHVNDAVIFYSLGNFIFDQGWSRTRETAVAEYELFEDGSARVNFIPMYVHESHPQPLTGPLASYRQSRIYTALTKDADPATYVREEDRLTFELDHSHIFEDNDERDITDGE